MRFQADLTRPTFQFDRIELKDGKATISGRSTDLGGPPPPPRECPGRSQSGLEVHAHPAVRLTDRQPSRRNGDRQADDEAVGSVGSKLNAPESTRVTVPRPPETGPS